MGVGMAVLVAAAASGLATPDTQADGGGSARSHDRAELPRGGDRLFPRHRVIGFYGAPQSPQLGELGIGSVTSAARRLKRQARPYRRLSPRSRVLPAFELISVIATAGPGSDGLYRARQDDEVVRRYLRVAERRRFLMLLDIQPGRSTFIREAKHLRRFLREPNVGLALDPEWNVGPNGVPGKRIGSVSASMVNRVSALMARVARRHRLPQKLLVVHQFTEAMLHGKRRLRSHRRVAFVLNADGFGNPSQKRAKYRELAPRANSRQPGFKLFYREDTNLMSPQQVLALEPRPRFIVYE
jgi:broad specificity phosphatase PhoE